MYAEVFPSRLKKARKDAGYTQEQVSKETGISRTIIAYLETGKREPSLENLGILIDFYEVSADWILGTGKTKR
ncbi:MAG: helix-turn-helix domain-containing protein [Acetatifactor sp.]|nr:helix-turn-helix domain-containing protein [Acetatifactor sp.]